MVTSFHLALRTAGSNSAPARNVNSTAPEAARKRSHSMSAPSASGLTYPSQKAPAATPTQISVRAIDTRK